MDNFILGINYWPRKKTMYWWKFFEQKEVENDFHFLSTIGINLIRIFLMWEDFQPEVDGISNNSLENLIFLAACAEKHSLQITVTFFCGHMSGANWMPYWMIEPSTTPTRFPVYSPKYT